MDSAGAASKPAGSLGEEFAAAKRTVVYICGDCGKDVEIKPKDTIACHDCGHRILYKKRTKEVIQFDAR